MNEYREGKVKRTANSGVKKTLKPCAYNLLERLRAVTACLLHNEPTSWSLLARLNISDVEPKRKRVLKSVKSVAPDAKPCDLPLVRLKFW